MKRIPVQSVPSAGILREGVDEGTPDSSRWRKGTKGKAEPPGEQKSEKLLKP